MGVYYIGSIPCSGGDIYHFGVKGMKWGKHLFGLWDKYVTGATAKRNANEFQRRSDIARSQFKEASQQGNARRAGLALGSGTRYNRLANEARAKYNRSLFGRVESAASAAQQAMAKAREKVSTAYADAAAAIGRKGLDIQSFYSQVMQKAQGAINQGEDMVRQYGGQFVSQIQTLGGKALEGGKKFLEGIMFKVKRSAAYANHYITSEKNKKKPKTDPNSLTFENGKVKSSGSGMVPENHPEAQRHTRYIDYDGRVRTSETNTYGGYKHRMQNPGHLDPTEEKAFARARKAWHQPYRDYKRKKEERTDTQTRRGLDDVWDYYADHEPEKLPAYIENVYNPKMTELQRKRFQREREAKSERRH